MIPFESILIILANGLMSAIIIGLFLILAIYIAGRMLWKKIKHEMLSWIKLIRKEIAIDSTTSRTDEIRRKYSGF